MRIIINCLFLCKEAQTFAIRLSVHHKPCTYTGEICAHMGQLLNVHLLLLVVVMRGNRANYVLRSFRMQVQRYKIITRFTTKTKKKDRPIF